MPINSWFCLLIHAEVIVNVVFQQIGFGYVVCKAIIRTLLILLNNLYCIPTYLMWRVILSPLLHLSPRFYYIIVDTIFKWQSELVAFWAWTAGYTGMCWVGWTAGYIGKYWEAWTAGYTGMCWVGWTAGYTGISWAWTAGYTGIYSWYWMAWTSGYTSILSCLETWL